MELNENINFNVKLQHETRRRADCGTDDGPVGWLLQQPAADSVADTRRQAADTG